MKEPVKVLNLIFHMNKKIQKKQILTSNFKALWRVFILSEDLEETDQSETSIMKLAYAKNKIIADKKKFF